MITAEQARQAQQTIGTILSLTNQLSQFAAKATNLIKGGFVVHVDFSPIPITMTQAQQDDMTAYYANLKAQMVAAFNQLP